LDELGDTISKRPIAPGREATGIGGLYGDDGFKILLMQEQPDRLFVDGLESDPKGF